MKFGSLFEDQCEYSAVFVTSGQVKTTVVKTHYLTGYAQTYAGALLSCGVEWDEYLLLAFFADRTSVIDHVYDDMLGRVDFCCDFNLSGFGLNCVPDQIDDDLGYLALVCIKEHIFGQFRIGAYRSINGCLFAGVRYMNLNISDMVKSR